MIHHRNAFYLSMSQNIWNICPLGLRRVRNSPHSFWVSWLFDISRLHKNVKFYLLENTLISCDEPETCYRIYSMVFCQHSIKHFQRGKRKSTNVLLSTNVSYLYLIYSINLLFSAPLSFHGLILLSRLKIKLL